MGGQAECVRASEQPETGTSLCLLMVFRIPIPTKVNLWGRGWGVEVSVATEALLPVLKRSSSITALSEIALTLTKMLAPA